MGGREFKRSDGYTHSMLDLTVVPGPTGPIHAVAEEPEEQQGDESVQVGTPQVVSRPPQYRYQLTSYGQFFVSKSYDTIDFPLESVREDVRNVWPHLAADNVQFFYCYDKAGRSWEMTEESSMSGLFDSFAEETVRSDGHTILILKLKVGFQGIDHEGEREGAMGASTEFASATPPLSIEGDRQEPPVRGSSDLEHSAGSASDSWILSATKEKVWPGLTGDGIHLVCYDKAGNPRKIKEASMAGLFDCFAEETVRPDGRTILILKLEVVFTEEVINDESPSTGSVSATPPPSVEGDHQESSVCQLSDADQSVSPTSDSWVLPVTGEK
ncbi:hypothetical protein FOZ63_005111 [Perkinsus olseni]|uniref:Uncharacterized protein n=1 Tax=Perkinsus olseni TaxID=32597 RepID=A0A7J6TN02_PEROL|nr:hypothetical protein FOZ63_005111 [Perkinsus olseni]KAF4746663.1 hypothetical protein FOZ62_001688 [Perkinsus olseni]